MPLSQIQIDVLRLLAAHRDPESYVAGATPLNRNTARYSDDIDVFHDREEGVTAITPALYRRGSHTATPAHAWNGSWTATTGFSRRYAMRQTFGYVLHPVDLAMNKVMAAAGRREVRDLVDLVMIHHTILPLGAVI